MARALLAILHKSLQMHEGHREHIIRELELGSASVGRHVTAAVADDIAAGLINVRLGPFGLKSDISRGPRSATTRPHAPQQKLFDNVISAGKQCRRQFETERLSSLKIDEQLNFCGLLDRQTRQLFAL